MKNRKYTVLYIIAAVLAAAAAVYFILKYRDEISVFISELREKVCTRINYMFSKDEFDDYADI